MNAESMELDAGDFEPLPQVAGIESIENESQSHKGSNKEPQTIKTSSPTWNRRKIIDWRAVEQAAIAGVPYPVLAKEYGTTPESIKVKAHQGQWPTPERVRKEAEKRIKEEQARLYRAKLVRANGGPLSEEQERSIRDGTSFRESSAGAWEDDSGGEGWKEQDGQEAGSDEWRSGSMGSGEEGGSTALTGAPRNRSVSVVVSENLTEMAESGTLQAARRALRSIKAAPESLPIRGASDLAILAKLLRSMAGLDSPQVAVNLELFTSNQPDAASLGVVIDDCGMTDSD